MFCESEHGGKGVKAGNARAIDLFTAEMSRTIEGVGKQSFGTSQRQGDGEAISMLN
jgi:hypothetical protein